MAMRAQSLSTTCQQRNIGSARPSVVRTPLLCKAISQPGESAALEQARSRRACVLGGAAAALSLINVPSSWAFGNGFPGYDINLEGRKRAFDRNKRELEEQKQKAADFKAARAAAKLAQQKEQQANS